MAYEIRSIEIPGIILVKSDKYYDERGYFMELSKSSEFKKLGLPDFFPQQNLSYSKKDVVRGLHYQDGEFAQGKLVYLVAGHVRDVFVDMRKDSLTYKKVAWLELNGEDNTFIYIPPGFAHGFSVLSNDAYFLYACTKEFTKSAEGGVNYNDPNLNIDWGVKNPIVSKKDRELPFLS